jgi:hypothetical protein
MAEMGLKTYEKTTHLIGNQLVKVNGDRAWAEHYTLATHRCPAEGAAQARSPGLGARKVRPPRSPKPQHNVR